MARRRNNSTRQKQMQVKTITRCKIHMKPVFEHETCSEFTAARDKENTTVCKNCQHSF